MSAIGSGAIGIGVLGFGRMGRIHAANVAASRRARLVAVADPGFVDGLAPPADVSWSADPAAVIGDPRVDAVLVCSSTATHAAFLRQAAEAGKHVFCEKPIDLDPDVVVEALRAIEAAGVKLQVGFNRRFDPSFRRVRDAVQGGEIGALCMLRVLSRDPAPPPLEYVRGSGGIFLDMMIHDFDMVRFVSGDEVAEVHARGAVRIDPAIGEAGDVDVAMVSLRLAGGALALIENSRKAAYGYDQRLEAFGTSGAIAAGNATPTTTRLSSAAGVAGDRPHAFFTERYAQAYRDELEAFLVAVEQDGEPPVSGADGLAPLAIGLAARRSLATGLPVRVEPLPGS